MFGIFNQRNIFATTDGPGFPHNASNSSNKAPDSTGWKVLMYQIPVPLGDCSIYVLLDSNVIKNCFIMDGGTNSGDVSAAKQIKTALTAIEDELRGNHSSRTAKKKQAPRLKFDSWVVTHWDEDHWRGVAELMGDNENGKGVDYFKDEPSLIAGATCPAFLWKKVKGTANSANSHGVGQEKFRFKLNTDYVGQNLIGRDLFQPEAQWTYNQRSRRLTWKGDENRPRFVCLGAGGYGLNDGKNGYTDGKTIAFKSKPSRNETSILSLLYWPSTNRGSYWTGGDGFPELTKHLAETFFETTGLFKKTIKVVKLDHHGSSREFSNVPNTSKISETFLAEPFFTMTVKANPSKIIVTPGDKYGHPCWDVILFLYCWDQNRKVKPAADFVASANQGSSKKSKAADKPDPRVENLSVVPHCADLVYTTRTPYWTANLIVGKKDANTTDGRVTLADKMVEDYLLQNDDVTMLELYREQSLNPRPFDWGTDPKNKPYKVERKKPEPKHVVDDREEIEQETRDNLAEMTREWWNWLSRQFVQKPQPGVANGDKFYMLKMTLVMDEDTDGLIQVLTPEGKPDPLTRPVLEHSSGMITRGMNKKIKNKEVRKEIKNDISEESVNTIEASTQPYNETDLENKGYPGGSWRYIRKIDPKLYPGLVPLDSGMGDGGKAMRFCVEQGKKDEAKNTKTKGKNAKKGEEKPQPVTYPRDPRIISFREDGTFRIDDADESEGGEEYLNKNGEEDDEQHVKKKGGGRYGKSNNCKRPGNDNFDQYVDNDLGTKTKKEVTSKKGTLDSSKEKKQGGKSKLELKKLKKKKGGSEENPKQNIKLKKLKN